MEDNGKPPERGTSYEENAVDKKLLEKIPVKRKKTPEIIIIKTK